MGKTLVVAGYGPGISHAVAVRFAKQGFSIAIVGRNAARLEQSAKELQAVGADAVPISADVSDPNAVTALIDQVHAEMGPITAIHWNAYVAKAGDFLTCDPAAIRAVFDVSVTGLVTAVRVALPDLRAQKGAVLVTNGGLGFFDTAVDKVAVQWSAMGLAVANSAKHKTVRMLSHRLKEEGVYVGEVVVTGVVKGSAFDQGNAAIEATTIASKFWELYETRAETSVTI